MHRNWLALYLSVMLSKMAMFALVFHTSWGILILTGDSPLTKRLYTTEKTATLAHLLHPPPSDSSDLSHGPYSTQQGKCTVTAV